MTKLLSIIIIGKNEEINLDEVFASVIKASDWFLNEFKESPSILYVDSQSTDRSIEIARKHNIPCLIVKGKSSPGIARNFGAKNSDSKFIFFLDGDTLVEKDFINHGVRYLLIHENTAGVGGMLTFNIYVKGSLKIIFNNYRNTIKEEEEIFDGVGGTFLYRRKDFDYSGGFSEDLRAGEEFDLMLRVINNGKRLMRIKIPMAIHKDYKSAEESFINRYLLTRNIFLPGEIIRRSPKKIITIRTLLKRYWLQLLYLPLVILVITTLFIQLFSVAIILFLTMLLLNLLYKRFNIKRTIISVFSMLFFSFGLWAGLLFGIKNKS